MKINKLTLVFALLATLALTGCGGTIVQPGIGGLRGGSTQPTPTPSPAPRV